MDLHEWTTTACRQIRRELRGDAHWREALDGALGLSTSVHLAIFVEPFLSYVLAGTKSIESRFSTRRCAPFGRVAVGDIVLLKAASGPVMGISKVARTWFFDLASFPLEDLRERFAAGICATDDAFWNARRNAEYATLLELRLVREVKPMPCPKRDRRGWVILHGNREQLALHSGAG